MRSRLETLRATSKAQRDERIADGHTRWGWPLDAVCDHCGDTGKWPNSMHYCNCLAGDELRKQVEVNALTQRLRDEWIASGVPQRFGGFRIATSPNERAAATVALWIDDRAWIRRGENLFLFGPVGTGKTGLAIAALWEIHQLGATSIAFWSAPELLDQMRPGATDPDPMPRAKSVGVLVLDDLGVEKVSEWVRERLYVLLDARYGAELPTIVTSNRGLAGLAETLGDRIVSRLGHSITPVLVGGVDQRRV